MNSTALSEHLRALALEDEARADEFRQLADDLDRMTAGFFEQPQTVDVRQFMGAWVRARRAWCDATGEPLV